jgi:hypothetical protein
MIVQIEPQIDGGLNTFHLVSAATTNVTSIKSTPGQVFGWYIYNSNAAARKVIFYNTNILPVAGTTPVLFSLMIPATSGANVFTSIGILFGIGIAIATTTGLADNDSAAVGLNDLIINIYFK